MKILDCGAHDGFVTRWILDHIPDAHVDGIELHKDFAAKAQARLNGRVVVGRAEDAPEHFEEGTYDAVVAYELLEHVPDIDGLLTACERMLKPEGRVDVSTPDGTFGLGNNPHHLRALRAVDLADLIRRRGTLRDMLVGSDGVTVVSYTPQPRREDVAIYLGPCWQRWSPLDIETKGLGGSETAAVHLAGALSDLGFIVTVYGDTAPVCYRDVIYRPHHTFDPMERRGLLIASRLPEVADRPINAPTRLLWLHDTDCGERLTERRAEAFDAVLTLSDWHTQHVAGMYPWLREQDRIVQTRNGINLKRFTPVPWEQRAKRVVYSSSPDRGLDLLLEWWPRILKAVPDAELAFCYPDVYDAVADKEPVVAAFRDKIRGMEDQPGVTRLGSLPQSKLAELMCNSRVWAHPSWASIAGQPFYETSCIGAMEAQAAGCHVVASSHGALWTTVQVGVHVNNGPGSKRWRDGFVREIIRGLTDPDTGAHAVEAGPQHAETLGWDGVAAQIGQMVGERTPA
jgi:SAM-dependent methyltransferase